MNNIAERSYKYTEYHIFFKDSGIVFINITRYLLMENTLMKYGCLITIFSKIN